MMLGRFRCKDGVERGVTFSLPAISGSTLRRRPARLPVLSRGQCDQSSQIISHRLERELQLIFGQPQVAYTPVVLPLFEVRKHPLNEAAFAASAAVAFVLFGR